MAGRRQQHIAAAAHLLNTEPAVLIEKRDNQVVGCVFPRVGDGLRQTSQ